MKNDFEYRAYDMIDVKVSKDKRIIEGRAVVYNSMSGELRTANGDKFREVIKPGALTESMNANDVLAFKEHNPAYLLGRKSAGTLQMEDRADGLYVRINIPETSYGDDALVSAERGDLRGFSFGFNNARSKNYSRSGEKIREINSLNLREVSIVASPAYPDTSLTVLRSEDFIEEAPEQTIELKDVLKEEAKPEVRTEEKVETKVEQKVEQKEEKKIDDRDYQLRFRFLSLNHKE